MKRAMLAALAATLCLGGTAGDPAARLADAGQEARARELFKGVRCVVCQNESIDESGADMAADLRQAIRRKVAEGETDAEIHAFLVQRYGDWILLKPPMAGETLLLWLTPALVLLGGGAYLLWRARKPAVSDGVLSGEEEAELADALAEESATVPPQRSGNKPSGDLA